MTREEEINNASYTYWANNYANIEFIDEEEKELHTQDIQESFINGAEWADEHPKQIEISLEDIEELAKEVVPDDWVKRQDTLWEMIRRNQRAQFIDKACKWLERHYHATLNGGYYYLPEDCIEQFRKAMKGD